MAHGFKLLNADGDTLLDTDDSARVLYQYATSGSLTTSGYSQSGAEGSSYTRSYASASVNLSASLSGTDNLVFIRPKNQTGDVKAYARLAVNNTLYVYSDQNHEIEYIVFEKASNKGMPTTGYGLLLLTSDAIPAVMFTSESLAGRIRATITGSADYSESGADLFALGLSNLWKNWAYTVPGNTFLKVALTERWVTLFKNTGEITMQQDVTNAQIQQDGSSPWSYYYSQSIRSMIIDTGGITIGS